MLSPFQAADRTRILALVLHRRYSGLVILDRSGLVSFVTWNLRRFATDARCVAAVDRFLTRAVRQYRPAQVVLGIPSRDDRSGEKLRRAAMTACARLRTPCVVRDVDSARQLLGPTQTRGLRKLPERIVRGFFPELADEAALGYERDRYRRGAWHAAALAIRELAERHPRSAFAVAGTDALAMGKLAMSIAEAERRLHPLPV